LVTAVDSRDMMRFLLIRAETETCTDKAAYLAVFKAHMRAPITIPVQWVKREVREIGGHRGSQISRAAAPPRSSGKTATLGSTRT
jgi:hypothetical protein